MNDTFTWLDDINIILIQALSSLNIVMLLPLNCYVIWLMFTGTKRTMESDIFSLNLSLSDLLVGLGAIWLIITYNTQILQYMYPYLFSMGFLFTARPLFQTCICVDYYLGVVHPVYFLKYKPLRYRVAFCCVAWLCIFASCIYCCLYFTVVVHHFTFFIQTLLFMAIVVFCCLSVLKVLKNPGPGENINKRAESSKSKQKAFKMIFFILINMIINFSFAVAPVPLQYYMDLFEYINLMTVCVAVSLGTGIMQPLLHLYKVNKLACCKKV